LDTRYEEDAEISSIYTDPATQEVRLRDVVAPKVAWTSEAFAGVRGRQPRSLLDVGAGGGHVVAGARRAGLAAEGIELSRSSRRFAQEALGVELAGTDFLADPSPGGAPDVITMFGLLEYTPHPARFLERAQELLGDEGLLVVEVPRADCVSTAVQEPHGSVIARHADPTTHVNLFSDGSLAELLWRAGFTPVSVWYFGMDAYELAVQVALAAGDAVMETLTGPLAALQATLDGGRLCDDVIVAAVPSWTYHRS
jgi:2-polyprenyl-3-methyl-5-hydroxy-6-metoxy-1,4-benzoquinol methylase